MIETHAVHAESREQSNPCFQGNNGRHETMPALPPKGSTNRLASRSIPLARRILRDTRILALPPIPR
jgi:hypothetical protein